MEAASKIIEKENQEKQYLIIDNITDYIILQTILL